MDLLSVRDIALKNTDKISVWENYFDYIRTEKDIEFAVNAARELRQNCMVMARVTDYGTVGKEWVKMYWSVLLWLAEYDFDAYCLYLEKEREPDRKFYAPRRDIIMPITHIIQQLEDDILDLATISTPPGVGKSTAGIYALSWFIGKYPEMHSIASGHSGMLTNSFYDGVHEVLTDPEYNWSKIFPNAGKIFTNARETRLDIGKEHKFSNLTARSIRGTLTGATRCNKLLYADDMCEGIEEAMSQARMDKLWDLYTKNLKTRKKKGCKELHIATRWSVQDVIGRLEMQYGENPRCKFLSMPALNENDESNFDFKYDVGFDTAYFIDMRESLDEVSWRCLFMNDPIEREGRLYHPDELMRFRSNDDGEPMLPNPPEATIALLDPKTSGTDYAFMPVGKKVYSAEKGRYLWYITDCICSNLDYKVLTPLIESKAVETGTQHLQVESNSAGVVIADEICEDLLEIGAGVKVTAKYTDSHKETRIIMGAPWVIQNCVFKHHDDYRPNSDYGRMMQFLCSYSAKVRNVVDDVPDGMAMFAAFAQALVGAKAEIFTRMV